MAEELPDYYFRIRKNGAAVFRMGEDRQRRLDMTQIATLNIRTGEVRPQGARVLSAADNAAIAGWIEARRAQLSGGRTGEAEETIERLNLTAQWAQSKADPDELERVTEALLLAMHDLRRVLVAKKAARMGEDGDDA